MKVRNEFAFTKKPSCPQCQRQLDAASCADGTYQVPSPGDYSGCPYCGCFSIFDENLMLRLMTEEEQRALAQSQGGFLKATAEVAIETYQQAVGERAMRHALFKALTGQWPEEMEDGEVVL